MIKYLLGLLVSVSALGQASLPSVRSVDTIADLVSMRTTGYTDNNKLVVEVLGYHSPNDGGGGRFAFTNSAASTNLGTIFASTRSGYQWHRLNWDGNVRAFGATGDGTTDDTASIQAAVDFALANNLAVFAPNGTYKLLDTIDLTGLPDFRGQSRQNTWFKSHNLAAPVFEVGNVLNVNYSDFTVGYHESTDGFTNAICFRQTGNFRRGEVARIRMYESTQGWRAGGTGGQTILYSVSFRDMEASRIRGTAFHVASDSGGSTGNVWSNIYINYFEEFPTKIENGLAFYLSSLSESVFEQINVEWGIVGTAIFIGQSCYNTIWNSVHFEGLEAKDDYGGFFHLAGTGVHKINALTIYDCYFESLLSPGNLFSIARLGTGAKLDIGSMHWDGNTVATNVTVTIANNNGGTYPDPNCWVKLGLTSGDLAGLTFIVAENNAATEFSVLKDYLIKDREKQIVRNKSVYWGASDANFTYFPTKSRGPFRFGTAITANRTVTLSTDGAISGQTMRFVRSASSSGDFTISIGGLASLRTGQWCEVIYSGSAWELLQFGGLAGRWVPDVVGPTQVLSYSGTNVTLTAATSGQFNNTLTVTNDCLLTISSQDGSYGTLVIVPDATNPYTVHFQSLINLPNGATSLVVTNSATEAVVIPWQTTRRGATLQVYAQPTVYP